MYMAIVWSLLLTVVKCMCMSKDNIHCYFVVFNCLYGRKVKFNVSVVLCDILFLIMMSEKKG